MPNRRKELVNPVEKHLSIITRYHYYVFFLLFLSKIPIVWHILNLLFLSPPMDFYCNGTEALRILKNECPCEQPWWDRSVFQETMQTKFGVLCENNWLISFSQSMTFTGALFGSFVFGFISDKCGRLPTFLVTCLVIAVAGSLVAAMPTAVTFIIMRFIEGVGVGGAIVTGYVLCVEYCNVKHREIVTALYHIPINIGHVTLPAVSYMLRHFDEFQLAISIPVFFFVGLKWLILESPKWLMDNGHIDEAASVIGKFSQLGSTENIKEEITQYLASHLDRNKNKTKIRFWSIFRHKRLTFNLICMAIIYFACGMGYYGVAQFIGSMSGNIHINVTISGAILFPGTIFCCFLLKVFPRRWFLVATNILSGVFILIVVCIPSRFHWGRVVCACISGCFYFMSFIIVFLFSVELFPTAVRNSVLGILAVLSRLGQIVNPVINSLSEVRAGLVFGLTPLIAGFLCLFLPETKDSELPSFIEDTKVLNKKNVPKHDGQAATSSKQS